MNDMEIKKGTVQTDTFTMEYFRFGKGEKPFVILPGLCVQSVLGRAEAIASDYRILEDEFTVYVFDRRRECPPIYRIKDMADDTAAAFKALGLKEVCLFGASQGGMIALAMAVAYPELVGKMALGSTSAHVDDDRLRVIQKWIDLARAGDREGLYLSIGEELYPPKVFEQCRDHMLEAASTVTDADLEHFIILAEGTKDFNVVEDLSKIKCPVFAVGVFEDRVLDSDATMEIAENLDYRDDFRLYMYVGFGHAAFDTAPDYRERLLKFFLE